MKRYRPILLVSILGCLPFTLPGQVDDEQVYELTAFEVSVDSTRGYLSTNSLTATGFNAENFKIPLSISVATEAFLEDIAATDLVDTTYYLAGITTGANEPGGRQGGNYMIRGFESAWQNRNGVRVYNISGTDNIARLEVVKGPNSVFYGEVAPGGIVNYVTKRASFTPSHSLTLETNTDGRIKGKLESEGPIHTGDEEWLAYRFLVSQEDDKTWRDFEYRDKVFFFGGLRMRPLKGLDIFIEYEKTREDYNYGKNIPMGNRQYMAEYADPPQELLDYILTVDRRATPENVRDRAQLRWLDISSWQSDHFRVYGTRPPRNVDFLPEATPYGKKWNMRGPGGRVDMDIEVMTIEALYRASDWLSFRTIYNTWDRVMGSLESLRYHVVADGRIQVRPTPAFGLSNLTRQMNFEALLTGEFRGTSHNLVLGYGQFNDDFNFMDFQYRDFSEQPDWYKVGWFPFDEPYFDLQDSVVDMSLIKGTGKEGEQRNYFASWGAEWFNGKLNTLAGIRLEQIEEVNVSGDGTTLSKGPLYEEVSPMFGFSFEFMEGVSIFSSYSRSARPGPGSLVLGNGATPEELGDPGPPGIGEGFDFGLKASIRDNYLTGSLNFFQVLSSNEKIVRDVERTDADPRNNDENTNNDVVWQRPAGERTTEGVELELVFTPSANYQATFSYTWLATAEVTEDPTNPDVNGARLGLTPEHTFGIWNKYDFGDGPLEGFSIGIGAKYMGSYNAQGPYSENQYEMEEFLIFDMLLRYTFDWRDHSCDLSLNIQNLLDEDYYVRPASQPGDPIRASLSVKLTY